MSALAEQPRTQDLMLRGKVVGVGADDDVERLTHPETGARLAERQTAHPTAVEVAA